ncbi:MAG: pyrimidine reductase family protein [Actinomycetes bacterium]
MGVLDGAGDTAAVLCNDRGVRRLLPTPLTDITLPHDIDALAAHYAYPAAGGVRANMVASVDGAISLDGRSQPISGTTDWFLFGLQRALADVILVGAGTARSEGYGPGRARPEFSHLRVDAAQASAPTLALVTRSGKLDPAADFFGGTARTVVITCAAADDQHVGPLREVADVVVAGADTVDLAAALDALRQRGLTRILTEGGPSLLGALTTSDLIDELVATLSPALVGGDSGRMVAGATADLRSLELVGLLQDESALFSHYRRSREESS